MSQYLLLQYDGFIGFTSTVLFYIAMLKISTFFFIALKGSVGKSDKSTSCANAE